MEVIFIAHFVLLIWASPTNSQQCTDEDWTKRLDSMSQCSASASYVNGLISQGYGVNFQSGPGVIKKARCCDVNLPYSQESNDCYEEQWWFSLLTSKNNWDATCKRNGYLIHGLFIAGPNWLYDIQKGHCCKPTSHPDQDGACQDIDVDFKADGTKQCPLGFFLKGIYKSNCTTIECLTKIRCCRMIAGRVDGRWSDWGEWQPCSKTCGNGRQRRLRTCTNPRPSGGGARCPGTPVQFQQCNEGTCPVDGKWSGWSSWGACSVTCGGGSQQRSRSCTNPSPSSGGKPCTGDETESQECNTQGCQPPCGKPDDIPHATYVGSSFKYNEKLRYSCEKGYTLSGPKRRTCRRDGKWSKGPTCSRVSCGDPGRPLHGQRIGWLFQYNDTVSFRCFGGYFLEGPKTRTCLANQTWSETQPICKRPCGKPDDIPHATYVGTSFKYNEKLRYSCEKGYTLSGPKRRTCRRDGKWSSGPTCSRVSCGDPGRPLHGQRIGWFFQYNDTVSFRCFRGYFLEGPKTRTCLADQTWSETQPICKLNCSDNPCRNGGTCLDLEDTAICKCLPGYTGSTCLEVKTCPPPKVPENGTYTLSSRDGFLSDRLQRPLDISCNPPCMEGREREEIYRERIGWLFQYNDTVSFRCFGGYFLEGPKTRTCLANQTWSETQPICKPLGPCSPNPCQNGGQCYNLSNSEHYCACDSGFTGDNCEKVNCSDNPCRNGGTCLDLGDTAICKCLPGYTGSICQGVIPSITKDPVDSVRMAGDVVKFCCEAKGDPAPKYAWFHNDAQIPNESSSRLRLSSISQADAGSYKCRATNEYGAVFSSKAGLTVIDGSGNDSCDPTPLSKVETLPPGCTEDSSGSSSVNVGACSYDTCVKRGQGDSGECGEQEGSRQCCSPASRINSPVTCTNGAKFSIQKVRRCACAKCAVPGTIVHGRAVDPDGNPLKEGDITVEGDTRRYKTNLSGYFKIAVKPGTKRLVFTIVDNRLRQLQETTKAFTLHESQVSFYTIVLQKKPPAITFSAKQEQNINLGGSNGKPSFANLDIPANAFITADGTIYDGEITANIGVVDPRSQADMAAAPGDFSAIDEKGEEELLSTVGILRQTFTDSNGNQLSLGKNITVRVDADQLDIPDDVEVYQWYLNKQTGRWVKFGVLRPENGGQRRKRQQARKFFVSDITPNVPYDTINWDYVSVASYVRVRAPPGTVVTRIGGTANGPFTSYRQETVPASGILCILSVRNQPAVLQAALNGVPLLPQQTTNFPAAVSAQIIRGSASGPPSRVQSFQFTSTKAGDTGPVYLKGESGRCQQSGPNDLAFEFGAASAGIAFQWQTKNPSWYARNICYMKAVVSGSRPDSVIYVKSTGKAQGQSTLDYGYTAGKSAVVGNQGVVCLEYSCNEGPTAAYQTHLQFLTLTGSCTIWSLNSALTGGQNNCRVPPDADSSTEQNFCVPLLQGSGAGLYADNTALARIKCLAGDNGYTGPTAQSPGPPPTTSTGWAVQLSCN